MTELILMDSRPLVNLNLRERHGILHPERGRGMGRILAVDYGDARTGLAVSDATGTIAGEAVTLEEWNAERLAARIAAFAAERDVETLVLGLPKNMDGSEGPRAEKARAFAALLSAACGREVVLRDERRSSIEAHGILHAVGKRERQHRATVDAVAASLLLESYLDARQG